MKLYLDVCCLNRPFDAPRQIRIRLEAEAVLLIIARCETGEWVGIGSEAIAFEVSQTPDPERAARVRRLARFAQTTMLITQTEVERAEQLKSLGFGALDALHIACAERSEADVFLTTDDRLQRLAARVADQLHIRVENPLSWLTEAEH